MMDENGLATEKRASAYSQRTYRNCALELKAGSNSRPEADHKTRRQADDTTAKSNSNSIRYT
jgi:hypothetical protein